MEAYINVKTELNRLKNFYYRTLYTYEQTEKHLKSENKTSEVYFRTSHGYEHKISKNDSDLATSLKYPQKPILQQLILVRMITSIEIFMVKNIEEIFLVDKKYFQDQDIFNISNAEILSFKLMSEIYSKYLNKLKRDLQNQGFIKMCRYYKKKFNINFEEFCIHFSNNTYSIKDIEKYHEMRHIIVHRLGKTDDKFREKYNYRKQTIKFENDQFEVLFYLINKFILFVEEKTVELINNAEPSTSVDNQKNNKHHFIKIEIIDEIAKKLLSTDYHFIVNEKVCLASEIIKTINYEDELIIIELYGQRKTINKYIKIVKEYEKNGHLKIIDI